MLKRALFLAAGTALTALGLVGLLIPIIPGVLFLALAVVCFSAASPRLQQRLERHPAWRGWQARWRESRGLPFYQRWQLAFWLWADATLKTLRSR
ncbi:MAG: DUF454 family protein [Pseudomonadota bacterium]